MAALLFVAACGATEEAEGPEAVADVVIEDVGPLAECKSDADCPKSEHPCRRNRCHPQLGCIELVRPAGAVCAQADACKVGGICSKTGNCEGATAKKCDDGSPCTTDGCAAGKCTHKPVADQPEVDCDDGDKCTSSDRCVGGVCKGGTNICPCQKDDDCAKLNADDLCKGQHYCDSSVHPPVCKINPSTVIQCKNKETMCEQTACQPDTGKCAMVAKKDGTPCDDGNTCTINTSCKAASCQGGEDSCKCKKDSDCVSEDDGNLCNGIMYCQLSTGTCKLNPATIITCKTLADSQCAKTVCLPKTGKCEVTPNEQVTTCNKTEACTYKPKTVGDKPLAATCDDGNPCTPTDACTAGKCESKGNTCSCAKDSDCVDKDDGDLCNGTMFCDKKSGTCAVNPSTLVTCSTVGDEPCRKNQCDPKDGKCKLKDLLDDMPCEADGSVCTPDDVCKAGKCQLGKNTCKCSDNGECTKWEDGDLCNGTMYCDVKSATCKVNPKTVVGCPSVDNTPCKKNLCQAKTGKCQMTFMAKGDPCDDGSECTVGDSCENGTCKAGTDLCQCQAEKDCAGQEDGNLCNGTLYCDKNKLPYKCKVNPKTVVTCPTVDNSYCKETTCVAKTGLCVGTNKHLDMPCDDADPCTYNTLCKAGKCLNPKVPIWKKCDDGNGCTDDTCDAQKGCINLPSQATCSDGDACTSGDTCKQSTCWPGNKTVCDDGNPCTADSCHNVAGCLATANSQPCDDGSVCTVADICKATKCVGGKAVDCSDGTVCTDDKCEAKKGCYNPLNTAPCSDGDVCTAGDTCKGGKCAPLRTCPLCSHQRRCTRCHPGKRRR